MRKVKVVVGTRDHTGETNVSDPASRAIQPASVVVVTMMLDATRSGHPDALMRASVICITVRRIGQQ
jgi:hypothetical protein